MPVSLPPLPYPMDALEPHMSKKTFEYHYGKHHQAYVDNLNKQTQGTDLADAQLIDIIKASWNNGSPTACFNNAAQVWNHTFFWESMAPNAGGTPCEEVAAAIDKAFGSYAEFATQFKQAGATQFGSGWAWLLTDKDGNLSITKTPNADTPIATGQTPILTMDVWEHAYYLDYQNARPSYMNVFLDKLVDWKSVEQRYKAAKA